MWLILLFASVSTGQMWSRFRGRESWQAVKLLSANSEVSGVLLLLLLLSVCFLEQHLTTQLMLARNS